MVLACVKANALSRKAAIFATPPVQTAISGSYILECGNLKNCKPNSHLNNIFHISNKILSHKCSKKEKKEVVVNFRFVQPMRMCIPKCASQDVAFLWEIKPLLCSDGMTLPIGDLLFYLKGGTYSIILCYCSFSHS